MSTQYLRILVENTEVDYEESERVPLALVYALEAIEDVQRLSGYHTKRAIAHPSVDTVRQVWGEWEEPVVSNDEDADFKPFQIIANGLPILSGKCKLRKVSLSGASYWREGAQYMVDYLGSNASWFADLQGKKIRELGFGAHDFTAININAGAAADYGTGDDYGYTLIKFKEWEQEDRVLHKEHTPFLFLKAIVRETFAFVGLDVVSTFMDTEWFEKLIIPVPLFMGYPEEFFILYSNVQATRAGIMNVNDESEITLIWTDDSTPPNFDNDNLLNTSTGEYTIPFAGQFRFEITFHCQNATAPVENPRLSVRVDGIEIDNIALSTDQQIDTGDLIATGKSYVFDADDVGLVVTFVFQVGDVVGGGSGIVSINKLYLRVTCEAMSRDLGARIDFDWLIHEGWTCDKLINGIREAFNLMIDTDVDEGKVYIEPADKYTLRWRDEAFVEYEETAEGYFREQTHVIKDADVDLERQADLEAADNGFTVLVVGWRGDDETVEGLDEGNEVKIFDGQFFFNVNRHRQGVRKQENSFFAKTVSMLDKRPAHGTSTVIPQIPIIWPFDYFSGETPWIVGGDEAEEFEYDLEAPRLLWFAGQRGGEDGVLRDEGGSAYNYPYAFQFNYNDTRGWDASLSFGNELTLNGIEVLGLLHRLHLQRLARADRGKHLKEFLFWSEEELIGLSFRDKVFIRGGGYILRKIDGWKPNREESTGTELEMDVVPQESDADNISSSDIRGYFID